MISDVILVVTGFVAGCIDSIAGGGGLITLPVLSEALGPGAHAIGTNKIVGTSGALIAFLVYRRAHALNLKKGFVFLVGIALGSLLGSVVSPYLPVQIFRGLLVAACPLVLYVIWNKQLFVHELSQHARRPEPLLLLIGFLVGFYDGFFGPGGGTFMLLGLLSGAKLPLFEALLLSKLANTVSAGTSLLSYGAQGFVHVREGLITALGMTVGGFLGARFATKRAEKVVRPVLALVVAMLLVSQLRYLLLG